MQQSLNEDTCHVCFAVMDNKEGHMRFHRELLQHVEELTRKVRYLEETALLMMRS